MTDKTLRQHLAAILPDATRTQLDRLMEIVLVARAEELKSAIRYEGRYRRREARATRRPMSRNIARVGELLAPLDTAARLDEMKRGS